MHWQLKSGDQTKYIDPHKYSLLLINCTLLNQKGTATKIYEGNRRKPCAWIAAKKYELAPPLTGEVYLPSIHYNPKIAPYWRARDKTCIDDKQFSQLITVGNQLYILET